MILVLGFTPFVDPLPIWSREWVWSLLLLPLCAGVALVYKAVKCPQQERIGREAAGLFVTIIIGMIVAAAVLAGVVRFME
jgi:hypothetical protein